METAGDRVLMGAKGLGGGVSTRSRSISGRVDRVADCFREATVVQKRVDMGSLWHCIQVPGLPVHPGLSLTFVSDRLLCCLSLRSPSWSQGDPIPDEKASGDAADAAGDRGMPKGGNLSDFFDSATFSAAASSHRQGVPSVQNPQESSFRFLNGLRVLKAAVKSISISSDFRLRGTAAWGLKVVKSSSSSLEWPITAFCWPIAAQAHSSLVQMIQSGSTSCPPEVPAGGAGVHFFAVVAVVAVVVSLVREATDTEVEEAVAVEAEVS